MTGYFWGSVIGFGAFNLQVTGSDPTQVHRVWKSLVSRTCSWHIWNECVASAQLLVRMSPLSTLSAEKQGIKRVRNTSQFFLQKGGLVRVETIFLVSSYCCLLCCSLYEYKISILRATYFRVFRASTFILDRIKKIESTFDLSLKICSAQLHLILVFQKSQQATSGSSTVDWTQRCLYPVPCIKLHYWKYQLKKKKEQNPSFSLRSLAYRKQGRKEAGKEGKEVTP